MRQYFPRPVSILIFFIILVSCKKSDPAPLGAQTNAKLLAGDKGKTKSWRLTLLTYVVGTSAAQTQTLQGCFADNLYTFSNNDSQDYVESRILSEGDVILLAAGGHGFKMIESSEMIEVKQGPYCGERDKVRFVEVADDKVLLK